MKPTEITCCKIKIYQILILKPLQIKQLQEDQSYSVLFDKNLFCSYRESSKIKIICF